MPNSVLLHLNGLPPSCERMPSSLLNARCDRASSPLSFPILVNPRTVASSHPKSILVPLSLILSYSPILLRLSAELVFILCCFCCWSLDCDFPDQWKSNRDDRQVARDIKSFKEQTKKRSRSAEEASQAEGSDSAPSTPSPLKRFRGASCLPSSLSSLPSPSTFCLALSPCLLPPCCRPAAPPLSCVF